MEKDTGNVTAKSQVTFAAPREIDPTAARVREAYSGIKHTNVGAEPMKSKALKLDSRFAAGGDEAAVPSQKDVHPVQP